MRPYLSANFVMTDLVRQAGYRGGPNRTFGGWTLSTNWFYRTGLPFTAIDNADLAPLLGLNYDGYVYASPAGS